MKTLFIFIGLGLFFQLNFIYAGSNKRENYQPLPHSSRVVTYQKKFKIGKPWPINLSKARITKDDTLVGIRIDYWKNLNTTPEEVRKVLSEYLVVSEQEWLHEFSHVAGGDQAGWIELKNKSKLQWMLRPGGLAAVIYPDGGIVYLSKTRSGINKQKK